ncbi:MAG: YoaK family protein [Rickettsiales bacterium]
MWLALLRNATARERTKRADLQLGVILAFIAGAINAGGFLAVGRYTSHMTGIVSSIGPALKDHDYAVAKMAALFVGAFITGAGVSSVIVNVARARHYHSEFASALMLEALLLLLFGVSATGLFPAATLSLTGTIVLLCFLMGLQNALISKISHSTIRTTHVTGIATDIGVELGRRLYRACSHTHVPVHAERLNIPLFLMLAFLAGSIAGAFAFPELGFVTTIPLALLLVLLAAPPILKDLRGVQR